MGGVGLLSCCFSRGVPQRLHQGGLRGMGRQVLSAPKTSSRRQEPGIKLSRLTSRYPHLSGQRRCASAASNCPRSPRSWSSPECIGTSSSGVWQPWASSSAREDTFSIARGCRCPCSSPSHTSTLGSRMRCRSMPPSTRTGTLPWRIWQPVFSAQDTRGSPGTAEPEGRSSCLPSSLRPPHPALPGRCLRYASTWVKRPSAS